MTDIFQSILPGLLVAIVASYVTAQLALRKLYAEKWWERKAKAYTEIIEALYDLLQYCEIKKADYGNNAGYSEEKMKELSEKYSRAYWEVKKATDIGAFVVSPEAELILKELRERPRMEWDKCPPWEIYAEDYEHYRDALSKIAGIARKDLKQ